MFSSSQLAHSLFSSSQLAHSLFSSSIGSFLFSSSLCASIVLLIPWLIECSVHPLTNLLFSLSLCSSIAQSIPCLMECSFPHLARQLSTSSWAHPLYNSSSVQFILRIIHCSGHPLFSSSLGCCSDGLGLSKHFLDVSRHNGGSSGTVLPLLSHLQID